MRNYICLKPINLDLEKRTKEFPPDFKFNLDYCYWLIGEIIKSTAYKLEMNEGEIWVPLCSSILLKHPYNYRKHLRYLCENFPVLGNVLWRNEYSKGSCYSYRLAPFYFSEPIELYEINDNKLLRFINSKIKLESNNEFKKSYNFLAKYFNTEKLKIDVDGALKKNRSLYAENKNYKKHLLNALQVSQIANGEFSIKHTPRTDGRIHSQITRLSKPMRSFLNYEGKKLAEIDISGSVPTFLFYILSNINNTTNLHLDSIINYTKIYYRHYMFCKRVGELDFSEISSFGEKILSGTIYECFEKEMHTIHHFDKSLFPDEYLLKNVLKICNREFDGDMDDIRTVLKKRIISMLNAKPAKYLNEEAMFNMYFPSILRWVKLFKKVNHKYFSYLTLQTESYFMLNVVARGINKEFKGKIPIFTLHDCIITTEDNLELVYDYMSKTLTQELGFTPKLSTKQWK